MNQALEHKFLQFDTATLRIKADKLNGKVVAIQRSKEYHKKRAELAEMQSTLHRMNMELKRRDGEAKRLKHFITPSAR